MASSANIPEPFSEKGGILHLGDISMIELASRYGTPLFVTSAERIADNYRKIYAAFSGRYRNTSVKYAVKANSNPHIISILAGLGAGADVSNMNEYYIARKSGVPAEKIVMSGNNLDPDQLRKASLEGVTINFDDIGQLESIGDALPKRMSFRVNPGIGRGEFPGTTTAGPEAKFGMPEEEAMKAYKKAKSLGAERFGVQMMTGSNVLDSEFFGSSSSRLLKIASSISANAGIDFEFIDIGGGYGVPYRPGEKALNVDRVAELVTEAVKKEFSSRMPELPELFLEPGRFLVADSTVLLGKVMNVKSYGKTFVGTDVGMNTLLRPALYGAYHQVAAANRLNESPSMTAAIVGQICENTDRIADNRDLPAVERGDIMAVFNAGAYAYSMSSQFNGQGRPAEVLVKDGRDKLIRRREKLEDLLATVV